MNGKIMMGLALAVIAWGVAAFAYEQIVVAVVLVLAGIALFVVGSRQSSRGR